MSKTFVAKPGDRWTREGNILWLYRDGRCRIATDHGFREWMDSFRTTRESDLPTPKALAQLRDWGYVVKGDEAEAKPSIPTSLLTPPPLNDKLDSIGFNALTPAEVREAAKVASDPKTKWVDVSPDDWREKCRVWQPGGPICEGNPFVFSVYSPTGKWCLAALETGKFLGWDLVGCGFFGRNFKTEEEARAALAKAHPPPDVNPEPDWKGLLGRLVKEIELVKEECKCDEDCWDMLLHSPYLAAARKAVGK